MKISKKEFFSNYLGFNNDEYDLIIHKCSGINLADVERIIACVYTVVKCGYPLEDLDKLIIANPYFMLDNPKSLEKKLLSMGSTMVEQIKQNPHIV